MFSAIGIILGFLALIFAYYLFSKNWIINDKLEKKCSIFFKDFKFSGEFLVKKEKKKPLFIIETQGKYEKIRTFTKKIIIWLKGGKPPQVIYVFNKNTYEEKEAFLIQKLIADDWKSIVTLDIAFINAMVNFFAYKYSQGKRKFNDRLIQILREDYESCSKRDCILKLDDPEFGFEIVLNPPPEKQSILHIIILPLAIDQNNRVKGKSFHTKENLKVKIMEIVDLIYRKKCGILFIGNLPFDEYTKLLLSNINYYDYFLLSAWGRQTFSLISVNKKFVANLPSGKRYERFTYEGTYYFRGKKKGISNYNYTLLKKIRTP